MKMLSKKSTANLFLALVKYILAPAFLVGLLTASFGIYQSQNTSVQFAVKEGFIPFRTQLPICLAISNRIPQVMLKELGIESIYEKETLYALSHAYVPSYSASLSGGELNARIKNQATLKLDTQEMGSCFAKVSAYAGTAAILLGIDTKYNAIEAQHDHIMDGLFQKRKALMQSFIKDNHFNSSKLENGVVDGQFAKDPQLIEILKNKSFLKEEEAQLQLQIKMDQENQRYAEALNELLSNQIQHQLHENIFQRIGKLFDSAN